MSIETFCEQVIKELHEIYGEGARIEVHQVYKNNGICLHGISILEDNKTIAPNIYIDNYYQRFILGDMCISQIVLEIANQNDNIKITSIEPFEWKWEVIQDKVYCKLINKDANEERLRNIPHKEYLDLAITARVIHGLDEDGVSSAEVDYKTLQMLDITEEELFKQAMHNTEKIFPLEIQSILDVMAQYLNLEEELRNVNEIVPLYVLTNSKGINGATAMLYSNALKNMADDLDVTELYIMPSSIHETIIMIGNDDVSFMKGMVLDANRNTVSKMDWLSDSVYKYNRYSDSVEIVA